MRSRWWPSASRCCSPPGCRHPPHGRTSATCERRPRRRAGGSRVAVAEPAAHEATERRRPRARCGRVGRRGGRTGGRGDHRGACDGSGVGRPVDRAGRGVGGRGELGRAARGEPARARRGAPRRGAAAARGRAALAGPIASARLVLALPADRHRSSGRSSDSTRSRVLFGNPLGLACVVVGGGAAVGGAALERLARRARDPLRGRRRPRTGAAGDRDVGRRLGRSGAATRPRGARGQRRGRRRRRVRPTT